MLYLSNVIRAYRELRPDAEFRASNFEHNTYAAHMGFFQAFGLDYGKHPGEAAGSTTYAPVTRMPIAELRVEANRTGRPVGAIIEPRAMVLAGVLARSKRGPLYETLEYALREILRNAAEHSESDSVEFYAQHWPSRERVEIAILDTGIGIRAALAQNPHLGIESDVDALRLAVMPGISGKAFEGKPAGDHYDPYAHSGYGLYMTMRLARSAGSLFVASGSAGLMLAENREREARAIFPGTAMRIVFRTGNLGALSQELSTFRRDGQRIARELGGAVVTASLASSMLARDFRGGR